MFRASNITCGSIYCLTLSPVSIQRRVPRSDTIPKECGDTLNGFCETDDE